MRKRVERLLTTGSIEDRVTALNDLRDLISEYSPFAGEPVDNVRWVPAASVTANDYNPNSVAPPEMELLRLSIMADGYTQPIVTNEEDGQIVVIDGFHRNRVGKECEDVAERIHGYLPVVQIRGERTLLRNDYWCKGLGFSQQKSAAYTKYRQMVAGRRQRWNVPEKALGYTQELLDIGAGN